MAKKCVFISREKHTRNYELMSYYELGYSEGSYYSTVSGQEVRIL
jgi:hypothetical protein